MTSRTVRATRPALPALLTAAVLAGADALAAGAPLPVQLGPRPYHLVETMSDGPLKQQLQACARERRQFEPSGLSIGHRGAPLQFPEHTRESYLAAARMGAGVIECDVTFTKDKALVCRHAQDDLHTSTDILATPLAATCARPFTPAAFDTAGALVRPADALCRTSDLTLAEFKTLRGRMDGANPRARSVAEYLAGTVPWRTDLYAGAGGGTLMSHRESIALLRQLGVQMAPELKAPAVPMPFDGLSQADYARKMIAEYEDAGVPPAQVRPQSFRREDVLQWLREAPAYGHQAVYLLQARSPAELPGAAELAALHAQGIRTVAPPLFGLLATDAEGRLVPSRLAREARAEGIGLIAWTVERSGPLGQGRGGYHYQGIAEAVRRDGDVLQVIDVLVRQAGVQGIFSDWPASVTFYANCAAWLR